MATLDINNVVTISVANPPAGLAGYQVNNLLYITRETPITTITGSFAVYRSPSAVSTDFGSSSEAYSIAQKVFAQSPNILTGGGSLIIYPAGVSETITQAITAMIPKAFFGGIIYGGFAPTAEDLTAAAVLAQSSRRLLFISQHETAAVGTGGLFVTLHAAKEPYAYARKLLYLTDAIGARAMAAAYASRLMSTAFAGSNTTSTMHMKELSTVTADSALTQTILDACQTNGVDVYCDIGGLPKVFCSGEDTFADSIYNQMWFIYALQVAGFNALATTSTKLPQTEQGVGVLKGAYLQVAEQAVTNGYVAPGKWNSAERFGNPEDFLRNISSYGYYIYSQPISQQSQVDRAARKAPLIQLAIKEAGAVHSTNLIVFVEA